MSNKLRQSELALALNIKPAHVSVDDKRGRLVRGEDKMYDIDLPENKLWIREQVANGKEFNLAKVYEKRSMKAAGIKKKRKPQPPQQKPKTKQKQVEELPPAGEIDDYVVRKRKLELKKTEQAIKLDRLKIQKIEGQLVPYDAVKTVFLYAANTFRSAYMQEIDATINVYNKILGGDHEQYIELKKEMREKINDIQKMVKEQLISGLENIQDEYKEVRGRGERK